MFGDLLTFRGELTSGLLGNKSSDILDVVFPTIEFLAVFVSSFLLCHVALNLRAGQVEP